MADTTKKVRVRYFFDYSAKSCFWLAPTEDKAEYKALIEKYGILFRWINFLS
ncbi:MAG: hypothetical protein U0694_04600 [Anaerolineae bacterium]